MGCRGRGQLAEWGIGGMLRDRLAKWVGYSGIGGVFRENGQVSRVGGVFWDRGRVQGEWTG